MRKSQLSPELYFSYGQFLVYDKSVSAPGCLWTEEHTAQGFARRDSTVCFGTLLDFGSAHVRYEVGAFIPDPSYERVVAVPFLVVSGLVVVDGPEEHDINRSIELPNGDYRLVAAQRVSGDEEEAIDLFFEKLDSPLVRSNVIVADSELQVPNTLIETADIA